MLPELTQLYKRDLTRLIQEIEGFWKMGDEWWTEVKGLKIVCVASESLYEQYRSLALDFWVGKMVGEPEFWKRMFEYL